MDQVVMVVAGQASASLFLRPSPHRDRGAPDELRLEVEAVFDGWRIEFGVRPSDLLNANDVASTHRLHRGTRAPTIGLRVTETSGSDSMIGPDRRAHRYEARVCALDATICVHDRDNAHFRFVYLPPRWLYLALQRHAFQTRHADPDCLSEREVPPPDRPGDSAK
jgi:hypothetical protein